VAPALSSCNWTRRTAFLLASLLACFLVLAESSRADIGPGPGSVTVRSHGYLVEVRIAPNTWRRWNDINLALTRASSPIRHARVRVRLEMPAMGMGAPQFGMGERSAGHYRYSGPAINMGGLWVLTFQIRPPGARTFTVVVRDHVR
jgi:hypothetical protein